MRWPMVPIGQLVRTIGGGTPSKNNEAFWKDGTIPWVSPKDMGQREICDTQDHITNAALKGSATQLVPGGSILVVVRSGILVRRFPIAIAPVPLALNQDMKALLPGKSITSEFLAYALEERSDYVLSACVKRGATVHSVDINKLVQMEIPLPPLSEQRRIVEILDQADALRKKRSEADAKAARILPALFYKMFGDPATNPKGWDISSLGEAIESTRNGLYKPTEFYGRGIPILKMFNIQEGELNLRRVDLIDADSHEYAAYSLEPGDILMNRVNTPELVGKCAVITEDVGRAVFESKNIRIRLRPDRAVGEYVSSYLNSPFGHGSLRSGVKHAIGMATINNADLRSLLMPFPPLSVQQRWGEIVSGVRKCRSESIACRARIDSLFSTLLHRAFTGDLTAKWRAAHMKELLAEMEYQAKALKL